MKNRCDWKSVLVILILPFAVYSSTFAVAPTVSITSPSNGFVMLSGENITIKANASGGVISKVEFFVDGFIIGEDTSSPYSIVWMASEGSQTISAKATNTSNESTMSSDIAITVNQNIPPTIVITSPSNNEIIPVFDSTYIVASAFDADGTIRKVRFYDNGILLADDTIGSGGSYMIPWSPDSLGVHIITAVAIDNSYSSVTSEAIVISVNEFPVSKITNPEPGDMFEVGQEITIHAEAYDVDGVLKKVEFYVGKLKIGEDPTSPYSINWVAQAGVHNLRVKATDFQDAVGYSYSVPVIVRVPNKLPTLTLVSPADKAIIFKGETVAITTNALDEDGRIDKIEFFVGADKIGEDLLNLQQLSWHADQEGSFVITVLATDDMGATITKTANVTVVTNPAVRITQPVYNAIYPPGETIDINADLLDLNGEITRVEFYLNGIKIEDDETVPYSITWTTELGDHTVMAIGTNSVGLFVLSSNVKFKVSEPQGVNKVVDHVNKLIAFPNPVASHAQIALTIENSGETSLVVYNQLGKEVSVLTNGYLNKGEYLFDLDTKNLLSGLYLIRLTNNGKVQTFTLSRE